MCEGLDQSRAGSVTKFLKKIEYERERERERIFHSFRSRLCSFQQKGSADKRPENLIGAVKKTQ